MSLIIPANTLASGGYEVDNSLRFNKGSSDYLNRTFGTSTSEGTWTYSVWLKISDPAFIDNHVFFSGGGASDNRTQLYFGETTGTLNIYRSISGSTVNLESDASFRDPSAWYNLCVQNNAGTVAAYINGVAVTLDGSSLGTNVINKSNTVHKIGVGATATYASSYMSEIVFIDGTVVAPTSFGEFDEDSGIWKPINVSGLTFGNNGFYLEFKQSGTSQNSSGLGADTSGNDNHFAVNNLTATDQSTDTCTNNFATLNPLWKSRFDNDTVFSQGNLKATWSTNADRGYGVSSIGVTSGKWYCEIKAVNKSRLYLGVGDGNYIAGLTSAIWSANPSNGIALNVNNGALEFNGTENTSYGTGASDNNIIQVALDMDNYLLWFGVNGTWMNSATQAEIENSTATNDVTTAISTKNIINNGEPINIFALDGSTSGTSDAEFNFGSPPYAISSGNQDPNGYGNFEYSTNGYYALNTKNLSEYG